MANSDLSNENENCSQISKRVVQLERKTSEVGPEWNVISLAIANALQSGGRDILVKDSAVTECRSPEITRDGYQSMFYSREELFKCSIPQLCEIALSLALDQQSAILYSPNVETEMEVSKRGKNAKSFGVLSSFCSGNGQSSNERAFAANMNRTRSSS